MADHEYTADDVRLVELLKQLQDLSPEGAETAGRITIRDSVGRLVGEALLDSQAMENATEALKPASIYRIDPHVEADLRKTCVGFSTEFLLDLACYDSAGALAKFDELSVERDKRDGDA